MRKILFALLMTTVLSSCFEEETGEALLHEYKMIEIYLDPGDGSGIYQAVDSDKTIKLYTGGSFTSNGDVCSISFALDSPSFGTYSMSNSIITPDNCGELAFILDEDQLIIHYNCIEPCLAKYQKQ